MVPIPAADFKGEPARVILRNIRDTPQCAETLLLSLKVLDTRSCPDCLYLYIVWEG